MYYVYILVSESSGAFYVGQTRNLSDRLRRHNSGRSRYTRGQGPWQLAYAERFPSRSAAVRPPDKVGESRARLGKHRVKISTDPTTQQR